MKHFLIFFTIALTTYTLVNVYIYRNVIRSANQSGAVFVILSAFLILAILSFPLGKILESLGKEHLASLLIWVGSYWLGVMVYAFYIFTIKDLFCFVNLFFNWLPGNFFLSAPTGPRFIFGVGLLILILMGYGSWRARQPVTVKLAYALNNYPLDKPPLNLVFVSDIHAGRLVGENRVREMVNKINSLQPDVIVIGGDLVDESPQRLPWMPKILAELNSKYGVYGILGNHEYYHGRTETIEMMQQVGIQVLLEETVTIDEAVVLVGVEDRSTVKQFGIAVKPFLQLAEEAGNDLPKILLHHTPVLLKEANEAGFDLQLSGHTHNGQLFPSHLFAYLFFKVVAGEKRIGKNLRVFVSNGYGTWGPPIRIGATPQIVQVTIKSR